MMQFVKLNHKVLIDLKVKGYNALRSRIDTNSNDPSWIPDRIDIQFSSYSYIKLGRNQFLLIENVLENVEENELTGMVFIEK
ncbi:hypothetical protein BC792_10384 [Sphingobacterium allocomposti]|uniref:Uncharacterized protein n=1 Tax=Sphingobacterium allocomposti TaxID=415956 RepID=A0A5S5DP61_9SPHI|nr:hypothetical protein [Sphingobacterium composti Yoo et al. 2007 non Ten et al. 2007]TYP97158.1 hypothetical protein BC792_10384 [Sphingobacterium composti Yoo et al. 2007 non Ten et al. 2007]HLS94000.1 hypothetical protein [Sphingobacterium sp.]